MKKIRNVFKVLSVVFMTMLMLVSYVPNRIKADEGVLLSDYANGKTVNSFEYFGFQKYDRDSETLNLNGTETAPSEGKDYQVIYPNWLNYFGQRLTVKVNVDYLGNNGLNDSAIGDTAIWFGDDFRVWLKAFGSTYRVTVSFFEDTLCATPFNFTGAVSFNDPDQSNYKFDNSSNKSIYYKNVDNIGGKYKVYSDGLSRFGEWGDINNSELGIMLNNENSFTFQIQGYADWIYLPNFIIIEAPYIVEYYYANADGTYPTTPESSSELRKTNILTNPKVSANESDLVPAEGKVGYALDASKSAEWTNVDYKKDGTTVLKVYFKPAYTILYDKNAEDATGTMEKDAYDATADPMNSKENWTFTRTGYEFIGFKLENNDPLYEKNTSENYQYDFRDTLLAEEDRSITLFAQWKELDYKIEYYPNADDATGTMTTDEFKYTAEKMDSKDTWTFTRPGYDFIGFKVENDGPLYEKNTEGKYDYPFKPDLILEDDRTIRLYAQWQEKEYTIKYDPNAETAEGTMTDDVYKVSTNPTFDSKSPWTYTNEGYDLVGYKVENTGDTLTPESRDYKDYLLADEDGVVTLYAQWEPWKYTIKYDPNGGSGTMEDHVYKYPDDKMYSDPNKYTRTDYKFIGFLYTDKDGNKTLYKDINDFKAELLKLGKNSEILLVAQWEYAPAKKDDGGYEIPLTGIVK